MYLIIGKKIVLKLNCNKIVLLRGSPVITRARKEILQELRKKWDLNEGNKMFDVKSDTRISLAAKRGYYFDSTFYQDQQSSRKLRMVTTKVTEDFIRQEEQRKKTEAIIARRKISAYSSKEAFICSDTTQLAIKGTDTHIDDSGECSSSSEEWDFPHNSNSVITAKMKTRGKCLSKDPPLHKNAATQVEDPCIPNVSVRLPAVRNQQDRLFKPCYLEAISLLMAESLSASEAIRAIYIVDTTVWNQTRYLPLELDKMYTNSLAKYKKLQKQNPSTEGVQDDSDQPNNGLCSWSGNSCRSEIVKLDEIVETKKRRDKKISAVFYHHSSVCGITTDY